MFNPLLNPAISIGEYTKEPDLTGFNVFHNRHRQAGCGHRDLANMKLLAQKVKERTVTR